VERSYSVLWVGTRRTPDAIILEPHGDIDLATVGDLEDSIRAAEATGTGRIVIDLAAASMLDSAGLRCLVSAYDRAVEAHRELVIRAGSSRIRRVFDVAGLADRLPLVG
jgi:anti-sigma B factor antagonist